MRRLFFLLVLLGSPALHAESGFISRLLNHPVPGGVAVVPLMYRIFSDNQLK